MAKVNQVLEGVVKRIVEQLEQGVAPWQKPWKKSNNCGGIILKRNYVTKRPYDILNQWLLSDVESYEFLTFKQISALGASIKKGSKAHYVIGRFMSEKTFTTTTTDAEGNEVENEYTKKYYSYRYYQVFALCDVEGLKSKITLPLTIDEPTEEPIEIAEEVVANYLSHNATLKLRKGSDSAFFRPSTDEVCVPSLSQYAVKEEYYSTLFHEFTHSSGTANRCNRKGITELDRFDSLQYSKEELIAEMGSAFMLAIIGIDSDKAFINSVAYLQGWAKKILDNPNWVVDASLSATTAVKYMLKGSTFEDMFE